MGRRRIGSWLFLVLISCLSFFSCSNDGVTTGRIAVVGIQPFDDFDISLADTVSRALILTYGVKTSVLKREVIPDEAFINLKTPRYRADKIIRILKDEKPDSLTYIVSLTEKDISTTKRDKSGNVKEPKGKYEDWGIFGLGYRPGPSCIISTFRIKNTSKNNFILRLKKISIHELGHNMGLEHCDSDLCVMRDAVETIKTIDHVGATLCENCKKKLK